jgi:hypothetical protein
MSVVVTVDVPIAEFDSRGKQAERQIERALNRALKDVLKRVEQAQIKIYTQTMRPPKPPQSKYRRTFVLQGSSETEVTSASLPEIRGEWRASEGKARYAPYVIGRRRDQAFIHRGRWKSIEEVEQEINNAAPGIVEKHLEKAV